jgi:NADPH:quinone reductase-like Zn-dependent oxidoreductase
MQAIIQTTYGSPDVLSLADVALPAVGDHGVLVTVHASAVTQGDRRLRAGDFPGISWLPGRLGLGLTGPRRPTPGTVFAGRVAAVGRAVTRFAVGDDVFGSAMRGAHAEHLVVPEGGAVARMPAGIGYPEAATLPYGSLTALVFLRDLAAVAPGQRVCIVGASGGVGHHAVQLASHFGAEVTAVCSARNHDFVRSLGADHVVDYRTTDFWRAGVRYDVILDTIGATGFLRSRRALTPRGRYLSLILTAGLLLQMLGTALVRGRRAVGGVALGSPQHMDDLRALVEAGATRPLIDSSFPLARIADAHARVESAQAQGTVVVDVASVATRPVRAVA